jgi:hypothetical protein
MKRFKIAGLCLVSMLVMGMALASAASAAPLWLVCLPWTNNPTRYSTNQCTTAASGGGWESVKLSGSDTVRLLAYSLLLKDNGTGIGVHCPDVPVSTGWGLIEGTNVLITKVAEVPKPEKEGCKVEGKLLECEAGTLTKVAGVHLPWTSEMFETEKKILSNIKGTGGAPGWAVTCGGITDTCEEEAGKPEFAEVKSGVTGGVLLVLLRFEERVKAKCSVGGKEKGEVKGLVAILLWNGNGLSVNPN